MSDGNEDDGQDKQLFPFHSERYFRQRRNWPHSTTWGKGCSDVQFAEHGNSVDFPVPGFCSSIVSRCKSASYCVAGIPTCGCHCSNILPSYLNHAQNGWRFRMDG